MLRRPGITNRVIADNDRSFQVSIRGFSRGHWSLVMEVLHQWLLENESSTDAEYVKVLRDILKALESHVVENNDGYSIGGIEHDTKPTSHLEDVALQNVRARRAEELKAMKEFEKEYMRALRKQRRQAKASVSAPEDQHAIGVSSETL